MRKYRVINKKTGHTVGEILLSHQDAVQVNQDKTKPFRVEVINNG
jgi:hypothetical protein